MDKNFQKALKLIRKTKQDNLTYLDLGNLELTQFPLEIFELINLNVLYLNNNKLTFLPENIGELTSLIQLHLSSNELTTIPQTIKKLTNLTELNLGSNQISTFPEAISNLTNLAKLYLNSNHLTRIPVIGKLTNLTEFDLGFNQLNIFPENILELANLTSLNLTNNLLTEIPEDIKKLPNLSKLQLSSNQISTFPEAIGNLTNLTQLDLNNNPLNTISEIIGNLTKLTQLFLYDTPLRSITENIGVLTNLRELAIGGTHLTLIPKSIRKLTYLTHLWVLRSSVAKIPESIGELKNLTFLSVIENQISTLPESIGNLTNLTHLYLDSNQLTTIPESIGNLSNLTTLSLIKNKFQVGVEIYSLPPKEQIQEILKWQRAQQAGTLRPIHEAKVIFIGESNFGKTHLIELLRDGEIKRKITTTHGIERSRISIPYRNNNIRLNIWDLGGQEFMRSTHQFFFSERTLYILVTLARRERNELNHWLKLANQLGNKAPVLVVINKIDLDPHDLDRKSLERDYPNIVGFVRSSIKDCKEGKASNSLKILKEKIIEIVNNKDLMPGVFEQRPPDWFKVKEELEKLEAKGTDFITYEEYENLKFIKDLPEEDRKINLKILSMIGAVISFVDDPRLIDTNVINPQWIMDGVYAIINDPIVKDKTKGVYILMIWNAFFPKINSQRLGMSTC